VGPGEGGIVGFPVGGAGVGFPVVGLGVGSLVGDGGGGGESEPSLFVSLLFRTVELLDPIGPSISSSHTRISGVASLSPR